MLKLTALLVVAFLTLVSTCLHVNAQPRQDRVDLLDKKSNRTGYAVIDNTTGRIDLYDKKSNRTGYGKISRDGSRVDLYDTRGNRTGTVTTSKK